MLLKLSIENYALIQELEMEFSGGFSVITGETGAGKSILLGALSLILGQRADTSVLLDRSRKCIVEGCFSIKDYNLEVFFHSHELDFEEYTILRREINQNGKSRAFINDTPVNLTLLKELGDRLVNIHSQNSVVTLNNSDFQLAVLDSYAGIQAKVFSYRQKFSGFLLLKKQLEEGQSQLEREKGERDYHQFLLEEINRAELKLGEQEEAEKRLELLTHSEEIKTHLFHAYGLLMEEEKNILNSLNEVINAIAVLSKFNTEFNEFVLRLKSNHIDLKDIAQNIEQLGENVQVDPSEIEAITNRLDLIFRLQKKHQVRTVEDLLLIKQNLDNKLFEVDSLEKKINQLRHDIELTEKSLLDLAGIISKDRKKVIPQFEKEILASLSKLGMPNARFHIDCEGSVELTRDGIDKIRLLFTANKGIEMDDISRIVSGGELSRLMLSIKSMVSQKNLLPTIIFDEIDSGVSGEIAGKVGNILKKISSTMQVIAITHLPQIAGKGEHHYWVYKNEEKGSTRSYMKKLSPQERLEEVAKMLSDETVSSSALKAAKELLSR